MEVLTAMERLRERFDVVPYGEVVYAAVCEPLGV